MEVKLYSKPNCTQCKFTEDWLQKHNIIYEKLDITVQPAALARVKELGFKSLPVIEADGHDPWFGFRPDLLEGLLNG
ncbi:glutaredoxin-like protein NrdH [Aerococcaceae bacterium NML201209]|nr:glutaredoxin-like protein NrdH [Aerococcaceae bacterium NML201209]